MDKKEKKIVKTVEEPKTALNKKEQLIKVIKKVIAFLIKSGLWKYVKDYWHRVVSHTAMGAALFTYITVHPELNKDYKELKHYSDSLNNAYEDSLEVLKKKYEWVDKVFEVEIKEENNE